MGDEINYYVLKRSELLDDFKNFLSGINKYLSTLKGDEFSESAVHEMSVEFGEFIDEIPYIGGDENPMTPNLLSASKYLVVYRVLKGMGMDLNEIGAMCYNYEDDFFRANPYNIPPLCNPYVVKSLAKSAAESGKYEGDFVYSFVEGEDFDLGLDFTECALLKLYKDHDAEEFMPYICAMDIVMSKYGDLGLHRTGTLADGCGVCDFRYKTGRDTRVASEVIK